MLVEGFTCGNHLRKGNEDETLDKWYIDDGIGKGSLKGTALLCRPQSGSIYKNVAVAPLLTTDGLLRVAIVWQTEEINYIRSELYVYDLCEEAYYEPDRSDNDLATSDQRYAIIQGKRIHSVGNLMGGVHTSSSLFTQASTQEIALGGLQLPHSKESQEIYYPLNVQYQKCFIWGPVDSNENCTEIACSVFDFSFADSQHLRLLGRDGIRTKQQMLIHDTYYCACKLHDDGFRIMLPDSINITTVNATAQDRKPKNSSFFPWKTLPPERQQVDIGSVTHYDPQGRRKALEREEEWYRERIRGMRRCGLTDFEIVELWGHARWTQWGQVGKPDDWKEL